MSRCVSIAQADNLFSTANLCCSTLQIISWNDYGESHYIGPIGADQPNSQAWTTGFNHTGPCWVLAILHLILTLNFGREQAWTTMTKYYADAWRTGVYPTITKNKIYISSRPHPKNAGASSDSVGIPTNWQWVRPMLIAHVPIDWVFAHLECFQTDDNIYCVVFSTGTYSLALSVGSSSGTFSITPGVNTVKLAMATGTPTAKLLDSNGNTVLSFNSVFSIVSNPTTYNFNYYIAASS